ncbi:TetR/AcrR family transcriptional regulator [Pinibacter soli]|uniref:TetR/AcrR family transcriptional regulator n=1 Tax=Pinibacter soli TaxID=3044211 RepID=A0ABT6R8J9_9BACT|nr:TetR/AcrR family transcriptional regulator [Pinibacter soli]MDI3318882.1 TetR/AcrR family transcriptional regulator [Pinibacter soli]
MAKIKSSKNATKKETIVEKASKLFFEKGFSASSMRDLAERVGVEAASLYNHIRSKEELLQEICFKAAQHYTENIDAIEKEDTPFIQKIEKILRFHIDQMINNYEVVQVVDRDWKHLSEPHLTNYHNERRAYRKRITAIVEEGIRRKEVKDIDAPTAVLIMLHAVSGIESWHRSVQKISAKDLEENILLILLKGLGK